MRREDDGTVGKVREADDSMRTARFFRFGIVIERRFADLSEIGVELNQGCHQSRSGPRSVCRFGLTELTQSRRIGMALVVDDERDIWPPTEPTSIRRTLPLLVSY